MKPQHSLETVAGNFKQWRKTRHSNRELTPKYLQEQVAALQNHHKAITIRSTLNLSCAAYNRWCKAYNTHQESPVCQSFITIAPEELSVSKSQKENTVICEFPNGVRLSFNEESLGQSVLTQLFCFSAWQH